MNHRIYLPQKHLQHRFEMYANKSGGVYFVKSIGNVYFINIDGLIKESTIVKSRADLILNGFVFVSYIVFVEAS